VNGGYFKLQKFTSQNPVYQAAVFYVRNSLKVTYEHLRFEKFFRGYTLDPVKTGREDIEMERKGRHGGQEEGGRRGVRQGEEGKERKEGREESGAPSLPLGWLRPSISMF
jgi:hypothetical protein